MSLKDWKNDFENKKVIIWGFGKEGKSSLQFIRSLLPQQNITVAEGRKTDLKQIEAENPHVTAVYDDTVDFNAFDLILKSPGIVVKQAIDRDKLSGQTQLFLKHYADHTIGITGTKGKSTTTSLVYALLKEKYNTVLVGNIGIPCFEAIAKMEEGYLAAFEMSCHQLEFCPYSPHIAVYLNLFEEHLDHYGTFEAYADAKANIFTHQKKGDVTILHKDLMQFKDRWVNEPVFIGSDIDAHDHTLVIPGHELEIDDCALIGEHNYRNLAVAYYIAHLYGISDEQVRHAARVFEPLHHRLEDLGEFHGIRCINDSISTIGQASIQAMEALHNVDVILIGGMDRGIAYDELEQYLYDHQNIRVVFMYATGHRIHEEMKASNRDREGLYEVENLKEAVKLGMSLVQPHHILLLSPAASSYDHFKNFEERGDVFRRLVSEE
ncbi:MAG: UDP-N-acetylmuramoyl-L-alanine--D-glutamate ligase [Solobacterium sp.]|jgi:UDP-N-acetylmuramoylalanine--D-glutamate ligase|nr:UDP-N-acetylmuramoyl-L-alanine--D-glutamate ligase [Solobacterium sp.]MCH4048127.1 UDP-N-acetylmuramoyl-L-alanine--D-glutamate ligase [Solobacterium sp.]MCH4075019.1 UDP-N-acetylmuramoyl-L-alanine--D-glutamate ligase [Solobacterium sp.]MCI1314223.1 UDP-N-acetylmuramoyl-L-alanine--D-glutamate ligase [Solobacterium sp.]MCI1346493.1 UDP-N-acetylmuramoyl-L-alanine--D-glutamate ligase [Solobacterium sp.]